MPPLEAKTSNKKKVNDRGDAVFSTTNSVLNSNNTNNTDNLSDEDDNGNRASVADLCKRFDDRSPKTVKNGASANKTAEGKLKKPDEPSNAKLTNGKAKIAKKTSNSVSAGKKIDDPTSGKCQSNADVLQSNSKLEVNEEADLKNGLDVEREKEQDDVNGTPSKSNSRVNNFASYISTRDYQKGDDSKGDGLSVKENSKNDMDSKDNYVGKIFQNVSSSFLRIQIIFNRLHHRCQKSFNFATPIFSYSCFEIHYVTSPTFFERQYFFWGIFYGNWLNVNPTNPTNTQFAEPLSSLIEN